ncbi:hypothetical protein C8R47DRAFT_1227099 [Mycena vitilis]|nr:hypothetical protein C8R47DRAFT_1227099 [Mycena vitilis]
MQSRSSYVDKLATEVWSNCWSYASKAQLKRLCLVCRYFRTVCQPLLFQKQSVAVGFIDSENWMSTTQRLHYTEHRLTKIAATPLALSVRTWDWKGDTEMEDLPHTFPLITHIHVLRDVWRRSVAKFSSTLGAFQRLKVLRLRHFKVGPEFRTILATLPLLQNMTLEHCDVVARTGALLPLRRFSFTGRYAASSQTAIELVDPGNLETLFIRGSPMDDPADDIAILSPLAAQPLPRLVELRVILRAHHAALLFRLLDCCPALESVDFKLARMDHWIESLPKQLPDTTVPLLKLFGGSPALVRLLVHNRPVVQVVQNIWGDFPADPDSLANTLRFLQDSACGSVPLQRLSLTDELLTAHLPKVFTAITSFFPDLREVRMTFRDVAPDSTQGSDLDYDIDDVDSQEEAEQVDNRLVELRDGSVEYARSEEDLDLDFIVTNETVGFTRQALAEMPVVPAAAPVIYLPGHMYIASEARAPVFGDPPVASALTLIMDLISKKEIPFPPHLEVLSFDYQFPPGSLLPRETQHHVVLVLEQLCPALRKIELNAQHTWVRARHLWTQTRHIYTWTNGTAERMEPVQIVSQVWYADGTRRGDE